MRLRWLILWLASSLFAPQAAHAQGFDGALIERVRSASQMIPGDLPREVRFQGFHYYTWVESGLVEGGSDDDIPVVTGVFQIRYDDGWIMVDSGADEEILDFGGEIPASDYERVGEALRGASLIIVTHEHGDHVAGLLRGPWADDVAGRSLITTEQLESLRANPNDQRLQLTPERAGQFLVVDYEELLPVAPGVVLIAAPGHTPGSQIVYVLLDSGEELLLVGDVVWLLHAVESGSQKPMADSNYLGEDRAQLAKQIQWLQKMQIDGLHLAVAHDIDSLRALIEAGAIQDGVYLGALAN